jgi:triosephosphate isomerase (TIM)
MNLFVANWKMNMNTQNVFDWVSAWEGNEQNVAGEVVIAPSYLHLPLLASFKEITLASQDISPYENGPHTGEVGAFQLSDYCKYAIVGHSERKEAFETVLEKAKIATDSGITPIICFVNPEKVAENYLEGSVLAWEDPQNISRGGEYRSKATAIIQEQAQKVRNMLPKKTKILYGGSVNKENISELRKIDSLDGLLVGHASLDPKHFFEICKK